MTEIASINPSSTWEKVFTLLKGENVTTVGGRASVVGVGGFVTGGGVSDSVLLMLVGFYM